MDYQFVCLMQLIGAVTALLLALHLNPVEAIVARDLVLTPKQGLQYNGKSLYYAEDGENANRLHKAANNAAAKNANINQTVRPWERTLKHVTFITLFANTGMGVTPANISKLQEYADFLKSPYLSNGQKDVRFGDIVTLASGRVESSPNSTTPQTYRFVEGVCEHDCIGRDSMWALWQVQKIRHRDSRDTHKYQHEIRYSISPMRTPANGAHKRRADFTSGRHAPLQTFIQKEDDYPQNFVPIVFKDDHKFTERKFNDFTNNVTPIPQSTFVHSFYQPHPGLVPPGPPPPTKAPPLQRLNIGEFMSSLRPQQPLPTSTPKIEIFPNLLQLMSSGLGVTPTTYRPNYQYKLPKPDVYSGGSGQTLHQQTHHQLHQQPHQQPHQQSHQQPHQQPHQQEPHQQTHHQLHQQPHHQIHRQPDLQPHHQTHQQPHQHPHQHQHHRLHLQYQPPQPHPHYQEPQKLPPQDYLALDKITTPPVVTHHFHHHFFTPSSSGEHNSLEDLKGVEHLQPDPVTPQYYKFVYEDGGAMVTTSRYPHQSTSQKYLFTADDIQPQHIVHVTQAPPLKKPTYSTYTARPILYYAPEESHRDNKTFIQSESLEDDGIRYSEPDPLYLTESDLNAHHTQLPSYDEEQYNTQQQQQVESPRIVENESETRNSLRKQHDGSERVESTTRGEYHKTDLDEKSSQKHLQITAEGDDDAEDEEEKERHVETRTTEKAAPDSTITSGTTSTTTTAGPPPSTTATSTTTEKHEMLTSTRNYRRQTPLPPIQQYSSKPTRTSTTTTRLSLVKSLSASDSSASSDTKQFVSTSTSETPLKAVAASRIRGSGSYARSTTTTTEQPVLKWKPRRKHTSTKTPKQMAEHSAADDNDTDSKAKGSRRYEEAVRLETQHELDERMDAITASPTPLPDDDEQNSQEIYEVLTQKSVSKSVSIKVGRNGEEIPIIIDDENVVDADVKGASDKANDNKHRVKDQL